MTALDDDALDGLEVLDIDGLTPREAATRLTDKSANGTLHADGPGEFWCPACGARCTRHESTGTEYGHLIDCPERELPDPRDLDLDGGYHNRFSPNVGESVQKGKRTAQLQNYLDAHGGRSDD